MYLLAFANEQCVCIGVYLQLPGSNNSALSLTSYLCRTSMSARIKILEPSQAFPGHVQTLAHVCSFLDFQEYVAALQSPLGIFYSPAFLLRFFDNLQLKRLTSINRYRSYREVPKEVISSQEKGLQLSIHQGDH